MAATKELMYFKVLLGGHVERYYEEGKTDEAGNPVFKDVEYGPGDIFASTVDRVKQHGANKFERLEDAPKNFAQQKSAQAVKTAVTKGETFDTNELTNMTRADLVKVAEQLGVEIPPGAKKDELINVIQDAVDTA